MPAKRPAPKSAKGKKAVSRPPARKAVVPRKPEPTRPRPVSAHVRKSVAAPKKPGTHPQPASAAQEPEVKKPLPRAGLPPAPPA
ncbi:MAG: hypothetical protein WCB10_17630, partial [Steroidobacteraceae bacterium]